MEDIVEEFQRLKPLLEADAVAFESSVANSLIPLENEPLEAVEEEVELEESLRMIQEPSQNKAFDDGSNDPIDALTGLKRRLPNSFELQKRNMYLMERAQQMLEEKSAPVLPITAKREDILKVIQDNRVVVLSGDTGCGKSTQMPQFILDSWALDGRGAECNIIVTQPRRLAALSLAQTVAKQRGEIVSNFLCFIVFIYVTF